MHQDTGAKVTVAIPVVKANKTLANKNIYGKSNKNGSCSYKRILYNENELIKAHPKIIMNTNNIMLKVFQT